MIYNDEVYSIQSEENMMRLTKYNLNGVDSELLYFFDVKDDEVIIMNSFFEFEDQLIGTFTISNAKDPTRNNSSLILMNMNEKNIMWETQYLSYIQKIHRTEYYIYAVLNDKSIRVSDILTGEKIKIIPIQDIFKAAYGDYYITTDHYKINVHNLLTEEEVFELEGYFVGIYKDKIYTHDISENMIRVKSTSNPNLEQRIDLNEILADDKLKRRWIMTEDSRHILGEKKNCNTSDLVLVSVP